MAEKDNGGNLGSLSSNFDMGKLFGVDTPQPSQDNGSSGWGSSDSGGWGQSSGGWGQ